jgi:hypothetical protein
MFKTKTTNSINRWISKQKNRKLFKKKPKKTQNNSFPNKIVKQAKLLKVKHLGLSISRMISLRISKKSSVYNFKVKRMSNVVNSNKKSSYQHRLRKTNEKRAKLKSNNIHIEFNRKFLILTKMKYRVESFRNSIKTIRSIFMNLRRKSLKPKS